MKQVSYQDLKKHLSAWLARASEGERVLVTRRGQPRALLCPPESARVRYGSRFGRAQLAALGVRLTRGRYLAVLEADRSEREER